MKKLNTDALEKMAKEKNIDKDKIEKIADNYMGKSENELMEELIKIGQTLQGRDEVVSKFKTFLDENQRKKLDTIMNKISDAEMQNKLDSKKSKQKKSNLDSKPSKESNPTKKNNKKSSSNNNNSQSNEKVSDSKPSKKTKKVVKKIKKPSQGE
ncbi:hypothetical protein [Romboutsia sp.]|uniref:hypothetical protein n=1 Tax=Romboutsia sp. TaxID=1965302 RepID=UPI002C0E8DC0|nr:hypothetical protein [Romboutsia sp.]HSQ88154.1 hypothetical protein [Romboutsia sp.]